MYLLDTDTIIHNLKGNASVRSNLEKHINDSIRITSITLMELSYGAYKSKKVAANLAKIRTIEKALGIVTPGPESTEIFGLLKADLEKQGETLADLDLIIAACALANNLILVTNNTKHFSRIPGLKLENWVK
jgi:tRNA(fMet)-specific endonuclease VapC